MANTKERFMAFLDIMGFQDLIGRTPHNDILKKLETISETIVNVKKVCDNEEVKTRFDGEKLTPFIFSDSIVIFTGSNVSTSVLLLLYACDFILRSAIKASIPIKGAISYGNITIEEKKSIFFGQPIIDSFLLHNHIKYYGVVLHHSAERKMNEFSTGLKGYKAFLTKLETPTDSGLINYYNLHYKLTKKNDDPLSGLKYLEDFYSTVSGSPRIYVDNTIEMYKQFHKIRL